MPRAHSNSLKRLSRGFALVEAVLAFTVFTVIAGSVSYTIFLAISVTTKSIDDTQLLYRVRRTMDHMERALASGGHDTVLMVGSGSGWTLESLQDYFDHMAIQQAGTADESSARNVSDKIRQSLSELSEDPPDLSGASGKLDGALSQLLSMLLFFLFHPTEANDAQTALGRIQSEIEAGDLSHVQGGTAASDAWLQIEDMIATSQMPAITEPLIRADHILFRRVLAGPTGPEYEPAMSEPPYAYYLRPSADGMFEMVYFNGVQPVVLHRKLTGADFAMMDNTLQVRLRVMRERDGRMRERVERRSILIRVP